MSKLQKTIKVSYNTSQHDIDYRKKQIDKFLLKGLQVKVEMQLNGRGKYLYDDSLEKLENMFSEYKLANKWNKGNTSYLFIVGKLN